MRLPRRATSCIRLIALVPLAACGIARGSPGSVLGELDALHLPRAFAARLSFVSDDRPCTPRLAPGEAIPRSPCATAHLAPPPAALTLAARTADSVDPDSVRAAALLELYWPGGGEPMRRAIERFTVATRMSPRSAPVLADLAGAYLVRAERTQRADDLLRALDAADSAVALDPRDPAGLYNAAQALDWLGADGEAATAWERYLAVDSTSGWAAEARARTAALSRPIPSAPDPPATAADAVRMARLAPQEARELGWSRVLDAWGAAVLAGDSAAAASRLAIAGALGAALVGRGGDATLAAAVEAIRAHAGDGGVTRRLARAHRAFAAAQRAYAALDHDGALRAYGLVLSQRPPSPTLAAWANVFRASTLYYLHQPAPAAALADSLVQAIDPVRFPALAGRARWNLGTIRLRTGSYAAAADAYGGAVPLLDRAGEREAAGAVRSGLAEAEYALGHEDAAAGVLQRALVDLRPYRGSVWLHNALYVEGNMAAALGLGRASRRIEAEDLRVSVRLDMPLYEVEARTAASLTLALRDSTRAAAEEAARAAAILDRIAFGGPRQWAEANVRFAQAAAEPAAGPATLGAMDTVVAFFARAGNPIRLVPALERRAEVRLRREDARGAAADLDSAVAVIGRLDARIDYAALRTSTLEAARGLFDRLAVLQLRMHRPTDALETIERGRLAVGRGPVGRGGDRRRLAAPPGETALDYVMIGDSMLVWTVVDTSVTMTVQHFDHAGVLPAVVARARAALERGAAGPPPPALAVLYDWMIRPLESRLGPRVRIVADGELADVPFAALFDRRRGRYLIEDHTLAFASTLRGVLGSGDERSAPAGAALVVADPRVDAAAHGDLGPLPGARDEADSVGRIYPAATQLKGDGATPSAVRASLARASLFHYAGHAVFDGVRPEASFLVLAGPGDAGRLTAAALDSMDLRGLRLVVLSACQGLRPGEGRSGAFAGFAGALLNAGAGGVVGSLWPVDDKLATPLMARFHRAYQRSHDGAAALHDAQLDLLHSPDPARRSPAAWAGFRYAGR